VSGDAGDGVGERRIPSIFTASPIPGMPGRKDGWTRNERSKVKDDLPIRAEMRTDSCAHDPMGRRRRPSGMAAVSISGTRRYQSCP
jgi:hypothetical protein